MTTKRTARGAPSKPSGLPGEDTVLHSLSKEDRAQLGMDAWEPSLLRKLLRAQNKLRRRRDR